MVSKSIDGSSNLSAPGDFTVGISSNRLATRSDKAEVSVQIRDAQYDTIAHLDRATAF